MSTPVVLVHSPLLGPVSWEPVRAALAFCGREVAVPDLTGALVGGPPHQHRQVDTLVAALGSRPAIVVGHSGAGPLLPAVGHRSGAVAGYVFVDAGLPHPGQSSLAAAPIEFAELIGRLVVDGWLPPWPQWWSDEVLAELLPDRAACDQFCAGCPPVPLSLLEEPTPAVPDWPDAPCAYLRLSDGYRGSARDAGRRGWPVRELSRDHPTIFTDPGVVAGRLLDLIEGIESGGS